MTNMHVVSLQYWKQVHGYTPDDVRKDAEGLQTMRTLARNMTWLLESIKAVKMVSVRLFMSRLSIPTLLIDKTPPGSLSLFAEGIFNVFEGDDYEIYRRLLG